MISSILDVEMISNISFLICKTCGIQSCFLFFSSKALVEDRRHLFPCFTCFHMSQEETDDFLEDSLRSVSLHLRIELTSEDGEDVEIVEYTGEDDSQDGAEESISCE